MFQKFKNFELSITWTIKIYIRFKLPFLANEGDMPDYVLFWYCVLCRSQLLLPWTQSLGHLVICLVDQTLKNTADKCPKTSTAVFDVKGFSQRYLLKTLIKTRAYCSSTFCNPDKPDKLTRSIWICSMGASAITGLSRALLPKIGLYFVFLISSYYLNG